MLDDESRAPAPTATSELRSVREGQLRRKLGVKESHDAETFLPFSPQLLEVLVGPEGLAEVVQEAPVEVCIAPGVHRLASVVQDPEEPRGTTTLNHLAHDLVVEEGDGRPGNSFGVVLVLFGLQSEADENLLEFFIDIVDAKLLETILVEYFEAINIEHSEAKHV